MLYVKYISMKKQANKPKTIVNREAFLSYPSLLAQLMPTCVPSWALEWPKPEVVTPRLGSESLPWWLIAKIQLFIQQRRLTACSVLGRYSGEQGWWERLLSRDSHSREERDSKQKFTHHWLRDNLLKKTTMSLSNMKTLAGFLSFTELNQNLLAWHQTPI